MNRVGVGEQERMGHGCYRCVEGDHSSLGRRREMEASGWRARWLWGDDGCLAGPVAAASARPTRSRYVGRWVDGAGRRASAMAMRRRQDASARRARREEAAGSAGSTGARAAFPFCFIGASEHAPGEAIERARHRTLGRRFPYKCFSCRDK